MLIAWVAQCSTGMANNTPPYVVRITTDPVALCSSAEWRCRRRGTLIPHGKPTAENLRVYCAVFEESTKPGGCNAHIGPHRIVTAEIVDQRTGSVVATYQAE